MTLQELYTQIEGDYSEALGRLQMEKLIDRFVIKFLDDASCRNLVASWAAGDEQATFEAAHSAKGVCSNLGLTALAEPAHIITEALRPGNNALRAATDLDAEVAKLSERYDKTVEAINAYIASK